MPEVQGERSLVTGIVANQSHWWVSPVRVRIPLPSFEPVHRKIVLHIGLEKG